MKDERLQTIVWLLWFLFGAFVHWKFEMSGVVGLLVIAIIWSFGIAIKKRASKDE